MDEPIDQLHADCTDLRRRINELYDALKNQVARWEPKAPPWPHPTTDQPTKEK